jgi:hypothetical protein
MPHFQFEFFGKTTLVKFAYSLVHGPVTLFSTLLKNKGIN